MYSSILGVYKALHILGFEYETIWRCSGPSWSDVHGNLGYGTLDIDIKSLQDLTHWVDPDIFLTGRE